MDDGWGGQPAPARLQWALRRAASENCTAGRRRNVVTHVIARAGPPAEEAEMGNVRIAAGDELARRLPEVELRNRQRVDPRIRLHCAHELDDVVGTEELVHVQRQEITLACVSGVHISKLD